MLGVTIAFYTYFSLKLFLYCIVYLSYNRIIYLLDYVLLEGKVAYFIVACLVF